MLKKSIFILIFAIVLQLPPLLTIAESQDLFYDELDQYQTLFTSQIAVGNNDWTNWQMVQSFTPAKDILTRIELFICRRRDPEPCSLAIRKNLTGENLTSVSVNMVKIPLNDCGWVVFNFNDIPVIAGTTYYMIISTPSTINRYYEVGLGDNNPYSNGSAFGGYDWGHWTQLAFDLCFKTYGIVPLKITSIKGGMGRITVEVLNNYTVLLDPLDWTLNVQGGVFHHINMSVNGTNQLAPMDTISISNPTTLWGVGPISIVITLKSLQTGTIVRTYHGTIIIFLVFISK